MPILSPPPQIKKTIEALQSNGFDVHFVASAHDALEKAKTLLPLQGTVGFGGSVTIEQVGLLDYILQQTQFKTFNQYENGISMEENIERRRQGLLTDVYLMSSNAVTVTGELVNVDGTGNRVAALLFGPKKVLVVVGKNKIVPTVEAGFERIKNIAAPLNVARLVKKAASLGKVREVTVESITKYFTHIRSGANGRVSVIIVNEDLGY